MMPLEKKCAVPGGSVGDRAMPFRGAETALTRVGPGSGARAELDLEWQNHVRDLLPPTRLLHIGDLSAAAIGDAGLRDLG